MDYPEIGQMIAAAREEAEMSRPALARAAGLNMTGEAIRQLEMGAARTPNDRLEALARAVGLRLLVMLVPIRSERAQLWIRSYKFFMEADERMIRLGVQATLDAWEKEQAALRRHG